MDTNLSSGHRVKNAQKQKHQPIRLRLYVSGLFVLWTGCVVLSLVWNLIHQNEATLELARSSARVAFDRDVAYRTWASSHGGVYVPASDYTPPNPYLNVPQRDVLAPSGLALTLINPAYMTRQVHEMEARNRGVHGHITSIKPIRPENAADPWETHALEKFEDGVNEVSSIEMMEGEKHLRLMRPLITEESCLACHGVQGYKTGQVRGGISVSIPMASFMTVERSRSVSLFLGHGLLWAIGILGIGLGAAQLRSQILKRQRAEERLQGAYSELKATNRQIEDALERATRMAREAESAYLEQTQIFNAAADSMCVIDKYYNVLRMNEAFFKLFLTGKNGNDNVKCYEILGGQHCDSPQCPVRRVLDGEQHVEYDMDVVSHDGTKISSILTATAFRNSAGELCGIVKNIKDISYRKQAEIDRLRGEKLQGVLEMAGAVCHELNQPLQNISGYAELLLMDVTEESPLHNKIKMIFEQAAKLRNITGKLMGIAKYETKDYVHGKKIIDIDKSSL